MSDSSPVVEGPLRPRGWNGIRLRVGLAVLVLVCLGSLAVMPVIGILAAIAIPNFVGMPLKSKRSEVPANVDAIATAELAYDAAFDGFIPAGSEAEARRSVGKQPRDWGGGWSELG